MNILLWILQSLLAFWNLTGGIYMMSNYENLKSAWVSDLPKPAWVILGSLQVLSAAGLVLPAIGVMPKLVPISAIYLAVYSLSGCALFAKYAGFPGVLWGVIPALLAAFLAYGRISLSPL